MCKARLWLTDGSQATCPLEVDEQHALLRKEDLPPHVHSVDLLPDNATLPAGAPGYYLVPSIDNDGQAGQIFFRNRPDQETVFDCNDMPVFLWHDGSSLTLAIVSGMSLEYSLICGIRHGHYYLYPRFQLNGEGAYEDLEIRFFHLTGADATWCGAARRYRRYQLDRGACQPLAQRRVRFPAIGEAALGPEVRIRMAWKPVPSPVPEQTPANEPPIQVAITFQQAEQIVEEFHRQGIRHANFCLVGWNKSGHDGRFPDLFPVEPLLGGEEGLRKLVDKARSYGYLISGHTNLQDSYTIAKRWSEANCLRDQDGTLHQQGNWGGGNAYYLCPKQAYLAYAQQDMEDMASLGFHGIHYLDVFSIMRPTPCYDARHPLNRREAAYWRGRILALAREKVGASGSEGSWDFCMGDLDYVLYTVFHRFGEFPRPLVDAYVPFWHVVYHGIVLYNTFCDTVNAAIKEDQSLRLLNLLWGGRPLVYFHAQFLSQGNNWMGNEDLAFTTPEQLTQDVAKIKQEYDLYASISDLQDAFIEDFEELQAKTAYRVTYSTGDLLLFNLGASVTRLDNHVLPPHSMLRVKPSPTT